MSLIFMYVKKSIIFTEYDIFEMFNLIFFILRNADFLLPVKRIQTDLFYFWY